MTLVRIFPSQAGYYLSGIVNESHLSKHLQSRKMAQGILAEASFALTTFRAEILISSGTSFEIIRDLVENYR